MYQPWLLTRPRLVSWNHTAIPSQQPSVPIEVQVSGSADNLTFHPRLIEAEPGAIILLYYQDTHASLSIWQTVHPCDAQTMYESIGAEAASKAMPYLLQAHFAGASNGSQTAMFAELQIGSSFAYYVANTVKAKLCDPHKIFTFRPLVTQASAPSAGLVKPYGSVATSKANSQSTELRGLACHTMQGTLCQTPARTTTFAPCHTMAEPYRSNSSTTAVAQTGRTAGRLPTISASTQNATVPTGRKGPTVSPVVASSGAVLTADRLRLPSLCLLIMAALMLCM